MKIALNMAQKTTSKVDKWITQSDKQISMSAWLKYEKADREYVATR